MSDHKTYNIYRGLQKPLVFKSFKGKYIYYGVGSLLVGLILTMVVSSLVNLWAGVVAAAVVIGGGLSHTAIMQKKGLHSKTKSHGVFIITANYIRHGKKEKIQ